jgi:hypothetical protein
MVHDRFEYEMPAEPEVVFDAFHHHQWRHRWDSLVHATHVIGGAPAPFVGAVTENAGGGLLRPLAMRTQFVSYQRPRVAAAAMVGTAFPFTRWAASMRHRALADGRSVMIYTYSFETRPRWLRWAMEPVTKWVFDWQTHRRFRRMRHFLGLHREEIRAWQLRQEHRA